MRPDEREAVLRKLKERGAQLLASDHFAALGVSRSATPDDVQKAFVEAAKTWHPDRVPPGLAELAPLFTQVFGRLDLARATLADAARRLRYVEELARSGRRPATGASTMSAMNTAEAAVELKKAEILLKKNDVAQAERHLRRAVQLAPGNVTAQALLVWLQVKPGASRDDLARFVADLDRLIALDASSERALFFRGQLKKRLGLDKEARDDFARASALDPSNIDAQRELRLYDMRHGALVQQGQPRPPADDGGFFKRLFKR